MKVAAPYAQVLTSFLFSKPKYFAIASLLFFYHCVNSHEYQQKQELLDLKQRQRSGTQLVQEIRKQADDVMFSLVFYFISLFFLLFFLFVLNSTLKPVQARSSTLSMPYRVQRIEEFVKELDSGDLKLRVRVLEVKQFFHGLITLTELVLK